MMTRRRHFVTLARTMLCSVGLVALVLAGCVASEPGTGRGEDPAGPAELENGTVALESFEGSLVCGAAVGGSSTNPCALAPGSRNFFRTSVPRGLETLLVGLTWEPTTTAGEKLQINIESGDYSPLEGEGVRFASQGGQPDIVVRLERAQLEDMSGADLSKTSLGLQLRVFPGGERSIVAHQPFAVHVASYLHVPAPADASPFPDA